MRCLTSARFNMTADILRQGNATPVNPNPDEGSWSYNQDPLTHEIVRVWQPVYVPDDPTTPDVNESTVVTVPCLVRGIVDGGIRVAGTTERFGELYENVDYSRMWLPARYIITKRDRVTNIKNRQGQIIWRDEETDPFATNDWRATVFEVLGVTPLPDYKGNVSEQVAMLQKADVYG